MMKNMKEQLSNTIAGQNVVKGAERRRKKFDGQIAHSSTTFLNIYLCLLLYFF